MRVGTLLSERRLLGEWCSGRQCAPGSIIRRGTTDEPEIGMGFMGVESLRDAAAWDGGVHIT